MPDPAWEEMWDIFHAAVEKSGQELPAFLDTACGEDSALRGKVERLLGSHERTSGILDQAQGDAALSHEDLQDPLIGERIGPYQVVNAIGEGGMGIVYEARQEEPVQRRVALKVIRLGMDTAEVVARFEAERQALALMTHAAVAKVFDGGVSDEGRPYFVMELVDGAPVTEYCDAQQLGLRQRLELFLEICGGVRHAHQKGIIHRDLKPSNLLVAREQGRAVPKIIDFGVAKAMGQRLTEKTLFTEVGRWIGTPEYMSPEQAEGTGLNIDTRSDVYSLGVVLYELLAGALPFDPGTLREAGIEEIRRSIREDEPHRPSTRIAALPAEAAARAAERRQMEVGALRRRVSGDLDWITMRALEKDPEHRYGSVAELADDIRRHLHHEPVLAGPPAMTYWLGKFARRHRAGTAFAAVISILLVAFAISMGVQSRRVARERDRANLEAERAARESVTTQQVSDFLIGLFRTPSPGQARGETITAREMLDRGAERVRTELSEQPQVQARLMQTIGTVYGQLGLYERSLSLEQEALEIRLVALGENHAETAESLHGVGSALYRLGENEDARAHLQRALEVQERVLPPDDPAAATTLTRLASVYNSLGMYRESHSLSLRAAAIHEQAYGPEDFRVGQNLSWAGQMLGTLGELEEGVALGERALQILEKSLGPDHPDVAANVNGLAILNWRMKDYEAARPLFERALQMWEKNHGPEHPFTASGLNNLGRVLTDMGEYDAARERLEQAAALRERVLGPDHPDTATSILNLGRVRGLTGDLDQALALYERGLAIREDRLGPEHPLTAMALDGYAGVLRQAGQEEKAAELEARAAAIRAASERSGTG